MKNVENAPTETLGCKDPEANPSDAQAYSSEHIQAWLVTYMANLFDIPEHEADVTIPFEQFGLDSAAAVAIIGELAKWLGREVDPNIIDEHPSIQAISIHLGESTRLTDHA